MALEPDSSVRGLERPSVLSLDSREFSKRGPFSVGEYKVVAMKMEGHIQKDGKLSPNITERVSSLER